jgi:hypothetical protein
MPGHYGDKDKAKGLMKMRDMKKKKDAKKKVKPMKKTNGLTAGQKKLPKKLQEAILKKQKKK